MQITGYFPLKPIDFPIKQKHFALKENDLPIKITYFPLMEIEFHLFENNFLYRKLFSIKAK